MPAKQTAEISELDLRQAWRDCRFRDMSFEACMQHPALSIALKRTAEANLRRRQRHFEQQRADRKRAQANDHFDHDE